MVRMSFLMVLPFKRLANEYCRQVSEDKGLDKGHQHFNEINEHRKSNGYRTETNPYTFADGPKNKDQGNQTDDDNVAGHHVRKKTDHKGKRLGDDS